MLHYREDPAQLKVLHRHCLFSKKSLACLSPPKSLHCYSPWRPVQQPTASLLRQLSLVLPKKMCLKAAQWSVERIGSTPRLSTWPGLRPVKATLAPPSDVRSASTRQVYRSLRSRLGRPTTGNERVMLMRRTCARLLSPRSFLLLGHCMQPTPSPPCGLASWPLFVSRRVVLDLT